MKSARNKGLASRSPGEAGRSGFTLVELLVVISIIAILSVIGIVVFTGVQKSSRDARRRADINAIANALEVNRTAEGNYQQPILATWFASGAIPYDPKQTGVRSSNTKLGCGNPNPAANVWERACWYCLKRNKTAGYCSNTDHDLDYNSLDIKSSWVICANLESGSPTYYCKANGQ